MPVSVRLKRMGNRNRAFYRVVAADGRAATSGRTVEELGWYDPRKDGLNFKLDLPRVNYWEAHGAQLSSTVKNLVKRARNLPVEESAPAEATPVEAPAEAAPAEETGQATQAEAAGEEQVSPASDEPAEGPKPEGA